jgi:hypothetical protein
MPPDGGNRGVLWAVCATVTTPIAEEDRSVRQLRPLFLLPLAFVAALLPGSGGAAGSATTLHATVGPGFTISVKNSNGVGVTRVAPGPYSIEVRDLSPDHSFHLRGPGVDQATTVPGTGTTTWNVTLVVGTYSFFCDAHPTTMKGSFRVGAALPKLNGRVGPGRTISLRTASGTLVKSIPTGVYQIAVRDSTRKDNFHLLGGGLNRRTGVKFRGSRTWTVPLGAGTYTYRSDAHPKLLRRTFKVAPKIPPPPPPPIMP